MTTHPPVRASQSAIAEPLYFGGRQPLFGWYHPARTAARECVAVLCPSLGHEYMYGYRAMRVLAERLAAAGIAAVRFDYAGTGDSSGTPFDPDQVDAWQASVVSAIDVARTRSGQSRVVLIGLRIGATLAARVAADQASVDSLVAWNPCLTGRAFVRQIKVLATTAEDLGGKPIVDDETGAIEGLGFAIAPGTADALSKIDMLQLPGQWANQMLLLQRDDMPLDDRVAQQLSEHAGHTDRESFPGYDTFMLPPIRSTLPSAALDRIVAWIGEHYPVAAFSTEDVYDSGANDGQASAMVGSVQEHALRFGHGLFGILSVPARIATDAPTLLCLNTGGDHRVGPHRLYVPLARQLAELGIPVFRFDFGGLGDSRPRPGAAEAVSYPPTAIDDVREAVHYLQQAHGLSRVIVLGLCSGGYYAVHAAHENVPLAGLIAVNPQLYWREGDPLDVNPFWNARETRRIQNALFSPKYWLRALRGDVDYRYVVSILRKRATVIGRGLTARFRRPQNGAGAPATSGAGTGAAVGRAPATAARERNVMKLIAPAVDTHFVFSEPDTGLSYVRHNVGAKLDALLARPNFTLSVVEDAGHTFMLLRMQRRLADLIVGSVRRHVPELS